MFLPRDKQGCLEFIREGLYHGHPVALLIWRHSRKEFREDNWHWVTITGYEEEREILIWSNCGEREEIPVKSCWMTRLDIISDWSVLKKRIKEFRFLQFI